MVDFKIDDEDGGSLLRQELRQEWAKAAELKRANATLREALERANATALELENEKCSAAEARQGEINNMRYMLERTEDQRKLYQCENERLHRELSEKQVVISALARAITALEKSLSKQD